MVYERPLDYNQHKFFLYFATFLILNSMQLKNKRNKNKQTNKQIKISKQKRGRRICQKPHISIFLLPYLVKSTIKIDLKKNLKTSCVTFFKYLRKNNNPNFDNHLWSAMKLMYIPIIQIAAKPPWLYFQVSTTLAPKPRYLNLFIFVLIKSLFQCLECLLLVEKYIEFSSKNKQLLTNPQSKHFTIELKSLQSLNWISLCLQFNEKGPDHLGHRTG